MQVSPSARFSKKSWRFFAFFFVMLFYVIHFQFLIFYLFILLFFVGFLIKLYMESWENKITFYSTGLIYWGIPSHKQSKLSPPYLLTCYTYRIKSTASFSIIKHQIFCEITQIISMLTTSSTFKIYTPWARPFFHRF